MTTSLVWDRSYGHAWRLNVGLVNYTPTLPLAGPVFPVITRASILPVLQALAEIPAHHVLLVVDEAPGQAVLGDIMLTAARQQQVAGVVCFGVVRDVRDAADIGIPLWAAGANPVAAPLGQPCASLPAEMPVCGQRLARGDWLIGDPDGLLAVVEAHVRVVIKAAQIKERRERTYKERLAGGERLDEMMNLHGFLDGRGQVRVEF